MILIWDKSSYYFLRKFSSATIPVKLTEFVYFTYDTEMYLSLLTSYAYLFNNYLFIQKCEAKKKPIQVQCID